ncbi:hypothetical protein DSM107133_01273 [Pseudosulfitobacter sp. DSM 107133]|jgi:hypothetical protein|nr:hypothetical protein DSM107133_01273 [Pseudosulfitobacter sp. DSM 107133]
MTDAALDALLQQTQAPQVSDTLMAQVLEAGLAHQPAPGGATPAPAPARLWQRLTDALGGWQAMGGLVAATCAGFWIGVSPPQYLPDAALSLLGEETVYETTDTSEVTAYGWVVDEGTEIDG